MHSLAPLKSILIERGYTRAALHELGAFRGVPIDREAAIAPRRSHAACEARARRLG